MGKFDAELIETALAIATPGKGILAADESTGTIGKRFANINVENNRDNRRKYRQLLFETPGLSEHISGVICFEETLHEKTPDGVSFIELLNKAGVKIGIKLDKGQAPLTAGAPEETYTQGLDGLKARCEEFYAMGARFAKWRAVIKINAESGAPTDAAIKAQTYGLAVYAKVCQDCGLMPIVEPECVMDGAHSIEVSAEVFERVWYQQIKELAEQKVLFEGIILKPNMVRSGADASPQASPAEIAAMTVRSMQRTIPPAIPGATFLSGGMSEVEASQTLNELNRCAGKRPWNLSFSYGRALQASVLQAWQGKDENIAEAQKQLLIRSKANGLASIGKYDGEDAAANAAAQESTYVKNYTY